ncbi:hypothetical protein ACVCL0_03420 [Rhodanobacter sp. UC4450_H17]
MSENEEFERFIGELQAIQPSSRRRNSEAFGEAFEEIEHRLAAKVPQKSILAAFNNAYDLKVSPAGFRLLLEAERERRRVSGQVVVCRSCNRPLGDDGQQAPTEEAAYAEGEEA